MYYTFLTWALDGGERMTSSCRHFTPGDRTHTTQEDDLYGPQIWWQREKSRPYSNLIASFSL